MKEDQKAWGIPTGEELDYALAHDGIRIRMTPKGFGGYAVFHYGEEGWKDHINASRVEYGNEFCDKSVTWGQRYMDKSLELFYGENDILAEFNNDEGENV